MDQAIHKCPVRILEEDELPRPDELDIGSNPIGYELELEDYKIVSLVPLVDNVIAFRKSGQKPQGIALADLDAEATSALTVALGHKLPYELRMAAMLFTRLGAEVMEDSPYLKLLLAYQGFITDVVNDYENTSQMISEAVRFWKEIIYEPEQLEMYARLWREIEQENAVGITSFEMNGHVCCVSAEGYAYAHGFRRADTVMLVRLDGEMTQTAVSIGTIAEDDSFMAEIHARLFDAEKEVLQPGAEFREGNHWILCGGNYIRQPKYGTLLKLETILEIVCELTPPPE